MKPKEEVMKKRRGKPLTMILKSLGVIAIAIVLFLAIVFIVNVICNKSEQGKIKPYGQSVTVDGKNMNVLIQGKGEETVVLLPGLGTPAPGLDFKSLIEELSPFYKVVVIEPFGYGLSDLSEKERSTENIVSEIHEALQQLNIDRYILMGHSIAGIYGLDYVNKYPNEVSAFVGLDTSYPTMGSMVSLKVTSSQLAIIKLGYKSGLLRFSLKLGTDLDPLATVPYDDETKEQMRMFMNTNSYNPNILNEMKNMDSNVVAAQNLTFPKNLPVMFFVDANKPEGYDQWIPEHEAQVKDSVHAKVMPMEGGHSLHRTEAKEIVENFRGFMHEIK
ncbi:pimeloyl-ACP methyl ester carboxylesterase [Filibacter limicola]|uniref:Pimeloyl-ACP methyl ester carboxylesterase n=1 Tax=Sporosarcina limicola TaxID=34101 RepID=A0A927MKY4_9BACL|nr:pimeloyl-ACP methyl ester carboxylesterase [Sporosarcina limicola]